MVCTPTEEQQKEGETGDAGRRSTSSHTTESEHHAQSARHSDTPCRYSAVRFSLLLAACRALLLALARNDLAQHHHTVAVHESDTGQALAILESVANQRLLRLETALRHLVGLQGVGLLHLLAAGLLAHFPLQLGDPACGTAAANKADGRVPDLDLVRDVQDLDLRVELASLAQCRVLLVDHHVAGSRHVVL